VRGYDQIAHLTGKQPLVVLPIIETAHDVEDRKSSRYRWVLLTIILGITCIVAVHFFVMNLEVLWFKALRKISLL
jgi:hypothetical protein